MSDQPFPPADLARIRELQHRFADITHSAPNDNKRRLWKLNAAFKPERPMILVEQGGVPDVIPASQFKCTENRARGLEHWLLNAIYRFEQVDDDHVFEPYAGWNWHVSATDYGVSAKHTRGASEGNLFGSAVWEAPIKNIAEDFHKLHPRTFTVNREATMKGKADAEALWDGILPVRQRGGFYWSLGMTWAAIELIGLEGLMMAMVDDPDGLHRLMGFLRDDHLAYIKWLEREQLLSLNNEDDYIGSGSEGYTHELPQADLTPGQPVRLKDLWVLSESQETVGVSPAMFEEFIFPYQLDLVKECGLCYYGCCEPVHARLKILARFPNLRRISVSPWCDQRIAADFCRANNVTFCRKPAPSLISTPDFDEDAIRADIRQTLEIAKGCAIEFSMKDVHNLCNQPQRLGRWVRLVRDEIVKAGY